MIIQSVVIYRGKEIPVSSLKQSSDIKVLVRCDVCGKERMAFYKSIKDDQTCHACANKIKKANEIAVGSVFSRLTVIKSLLSKCICKCECGNIKIIENYNLKSGQTKSCGCLRFENAVNTAKQVFSKLTGEKHPNWKGGISSERSRLASTNLYGEWREKVLVRDDFTCQKCGNKNEINTHHIIPYKLNKEIALNPDNGITLCNSCHRKYHSIYGHNNSNIETLNEYFKK